MLHHYELLREQAFSIKVDPAIILFGEAFSFAISLISYDVLLKVTDYKWLQIRLSLLCASLFSIVLDQLLGTEPYTMITNDGFILTLVSLHISDNPGFKLLEFVLHPVIERIDLLL